MATGRLAVADNKFSLELDFGITCVIVSVAEPGARATIVLSREERNKLIRELEAHKLGLRTSEKVQIVRY